MVAQLSLALTARYIAEKRAGKLSYRAAAMIGAAIVAMPGTPTDRHYLGYVGFKIGEGCHVWLGNGGGCRVTDGPRKGSPRRFHARPDMGDRLAALGRKAVAQGNIAPKTYRDLLRVHTRRELLHIGDGAAMIQIRRAFDATKKEAA